MSCVRVYNLNIILINILIYHKCPTCSGEPTPASSERTAASAGDADAKSVSSVSTTCSSAGSASERTEKSSALPRPDEH